MQPKLTVQERLKDLRVVDFKLTLKELAGAPACPVPHLENMKPTKQQKTSAPLRF